MRVSVSQIKNFRLCPTKWYISSILKIREPEKPATKLGKDFHTAAENHLKGGQPANCSPKLSNMMANAIPFLDKYKDQGKDIEIEKEITGELCEGITYLGYIDIWNPKTKEVTDLKTGNPDYFLTEHQLPNDLQLNIYAHDRFSDDEESMDPGEYRITHVQQPTKPPFKTSKVSAPVNASKFHKIWTEAQDTAMDMKSVADNVKDLPWEDMDKVLHKEKKACSKYGGCPYQVVCWGGVTPEYLKKQLNPTEESKMLPKNHPFTEGNSDMDNKTSFAEKLAKARGETFVPGETPPTGTVVVGGETVTNVEPPEPMGEAITKEDVQKEPEKKKRGRPKKDQNKIDEVAQAVADDFSKKLTESLKVQFCLGVIPMKSGITVTQFSDILKPFEDRLAGELGLTDIRQHKFNEPTKTLCGKKKEILSACKEFEYVFVDERDPVEDMLFRCMDTGEYIVWRGVR